MVKRVYSLCMKMAQLSNIIVSMSLYKLPVCGGRNVIFKKKNRLRINIETIGHFNRVFGC